MLVEDGGGSQEAIRRCDLARATEARLKIKEASDWAREGDIMDVKGETKRLT